VGEAGPTDGGRGPRRPAAVTVAGTVPGTVAGATSPAVVPDATGGAGVPRAAAVALAAAAVLAQIVYPLLHGQALRAVTIAAVVLLAAASLVHAVAWWGWPAGLGLLATASMIGLAAEAVGVATGLPFGRYTYADTLGPQVLGVPVLVPLAWTMMAYPALLLGRRLAAGRPVATGTSAGSGAGPGRGRRAGPRVRVAVIGGATLAAWDLFLDPQMVEAGHWTWAHPAPSLPGVPDVPLTNAAGWLLVGAVIVAALDRLLAPHPPDVAREALPAALLLWTWLGSTLANLVFFDRPWVALYGGAGLGLLVLPYLRSLARDRRATGTAHDRRTHAVAA